MKKEYTSKDIIKRMADGFQKHQSARKVNKFLDEARNILKNPELPLTFSEDKETLINEPKSIKSTIAAEELTKIRAKLKR